MFYDCLWFLSIWIESWFGAETLSIGKLLSTHLRSGVCCFCLNEKVEWTKNTSLSHLHALFNKLPSVSFFMLVCPVNKLSCLGTTYKIFFKNEFYLVLTNYEGSCGLVENWISTRFSVVPFSSRKNTPVLPSYVCTRSS